MNNQTELHVEILDKRDLTKTELKILKFICMGWLKPKIAAWLHRSYKTIDGHDENIRQKLHAHSNNEVIAIAVADGMVKISRVSKALCFFLAIIIPIMTMITPEAARSSGRIRLRLPRPVSVRMIKN